MDVAKMANGMCQQERVTMHPAQSNRFLIVLSGSFSVVQFPLDFAEQAEGLRQFHAGRLLPQKIKGPQQILFGFGGAAFAFGLRGTEQKIFDCIVHGAN